MFLARVVGQVVSSQKNRKCQGMKLLLIQPHVSDGARLVASGSSIVAVDSVGAGRGSLVMFTQGSSARLTDVTRESPVDAVIIGIVDSVEVDGALVDTSAGARP
jgi:microcompartment protein CcmK/EutM